MNILYITKLTGKLWAGPNYSVPAEIAYQSKYDNVCWYNINEVELPEWRSREYFYNAKDIPSGRLRDLPSPFCNPDLVVFEEPYNFVFSLIVGDVKRKNIPYVIVPRSTYTESAQKHRRVKKAVGNIIFMNKFIRESAAIHFLTKQELLDSPMCKNSRHFIEPNGIQASNVKIPQETTNGINAIYIGRLEIYQKGLDLLLDAISKVSLDLRKSGFILKMYGPDREGTCKKLESMINEFQIKDLVQLKDPVFGDEKIKVLLDSDVFIMTSRFEGLPMGLIEALAYAKPCLVTAGTNMGTEIVDYNAGWFCESSPESIAKTLLQVTSDANILEKSKNAQKLSSLYTWDSIAKNTHKHYESLIRTACD